MEQAVVFFDIDNTLWDSERRIPDSAKQALKDLRANGHKAFINTGRARSFVQDPLLLALPLDGLVCGCGTHIEIGNPEQETKPVYEKLLPFELVKRVIRILNEQHMPVIFEGAEYHWMNPDDFMHDRYIERVWKELGERARYPEDITEGDRINKFSAVVTPEADMNAVHAALDSDFEFLFHNERIFEAIPAGSGKAHGIRKLCELTGIPHDRTYAIGDSVNDLDMLSGVKHGICMGNGTEEAKAVSEYVTTDIHDNGIKNALLHYGLI